MRIGTEFQDFFGENEWPLVLNQKNLLVMTS
jgi:hypothetical protein